VKHSSSPLRANDEAEALVLMASPISEDKIYEHHGQVPAIVGADSGDCESPDARWAFLCSVFGAMVLFEW